MKRYAAKLLFQFQVTVDGDAGRRRLCEERIIVLKAKSAGKALTRAKQKGRLGQYRYTNSDGNPVAFQFLGVMELLCLDSGCEEDEVWYEITQRILPKERAHRFIPPESALEAIRNDE